MKNNINLKKKAAAPERELHYYRKHLQTKPHSFLTHLERAMTMKRCCKQQFKNCSVFNILFATFFFAGVFCMNYFPPTKPFK